MGGITNKVPMIMQMEAVECGVASLSMILAYYKKWVPLEQLREDCGVSRDGSQSSNILRAARGYGLTAKGKAIGINGLKEKKPFPCIIHWNFYHFVVLTGIKGKYAYINDPAVGRIRVPLDVFEKSYTGIAMVFSPGEKFEKGGHRPSSFQFAMKRLNNVGSGLLVVLLSAMLATIASVCFIAQSRIFIDTLLPKGKTEAIRILVLILLGLSLVFILMKVVNAIEMNKLQGRMAVVESSRFMMHLLRLPMGFFSQRSVGDLQLRQRENEAITVTLMNKIAPLAVNILMLIFYLVVMISFSPILAAIGVATVEINALISRHISKKRIDITRSLTADNGLLYSATVGGIDMIETLKSSGAESAFFMRWAGYQASVVGNKVKLRSINETLGLIPAAMVEIANVMVFGIGMLFIIRQEFTAGMLLAFTGFLASFMGPVNQIIGLSQTIQEMQVQMDRVEDVMKYPEEQESDVVLTGEEWENITKLSGKIEMKDITFGYSKLAEPLIEGFDLEINPGETIALVGASGSGKSTVGKLMSGLYVPWKGEILFDGKKISELPVQQFKGSLAVVDQDIMVFDDTVKQNIRMWDSSIEDFEVTLACRDACIHDEISARKDGYAAMIQPGGKNFSGGQLQRMEIARALAMDPTILILDEATSALDAETEDKVMQMIRKRGITCIVAAHRLSTIRDCDKIIVLEDGHIVEQGTHRDLLGLKGQYYRLVTCE